MAATTRTAHLAGLDEIGAAIRELKEMAGDRAGEIDVMVLYTDESILQVGKDVERHREALGRIAEIGATWVSFAWDFSLQSETLDFVDAFQRAGSFETDKVRDALAATEMQTFYGNIKFDQTGKNTAKPMVLYQVQDGKYKVVAPTKWASAKLIHPRPKWSDR